MDDRFVPSQEDNPYRSFTNPEELPGGIPVNTILFPMEGDPAAALAFWQLTTKSRGSMISPSRDWP